MLRNPLTKWLWDNRHSWAWWCVAIAAVGGFYAAFWSTFDDPEMREAIEGYPEVLREALNFADITTPAGYLEATVYGLVVAVLVAVYSIAAGARIIAGDEEAGTLELILAHPVSRDRLALLRFVAFVVAVVVISVALAIVVWVLTGPADLHGISPADLAAMHVHLVAFGVFFGSVSFCVGAATGRRAIAIAVATAIAVMGYAANGILPQIDGLEWTRDLSPFHWLNGASPLADGVDLVDVATMGGLATALVAAGTSAFAHRDVHAR